MENLSSDLSEKLKNVEYNYKVIENNINEAAVKSGRKREDIIFLAATKTVEPKVINHAVSCGLKYIGENRVQELLSKYEEYDLDHCDLQFIGHLQTNKVRQIIDKVSLIQSVDSVKLANEVARQAKLHDKIMNILIEVNIGREENKSGVMPEQLEELLYAVKDIEGINVKGLMSIPPICEEKSQICKYFENMHRLFIDISAKKLDNISMDYLSMGMSDDYREAVLCGANMVRVGSALFGKRIYPNP
ncbi:MAG: YggS family pyridoxal phosphate-dependent enzyme [Clostridia bacterium]|nr:YggS family pyridoxal phosphate-dependent enzyme [Clostridia bacterium]